MSRDLSNSNRISEQTILFFSVIKWVFLASLTGLVIGASTGFFLKVLYTSIGWAQQFPLYYWALPLALMVNVLLVKVFAPDAAGHGTEKVIEAVHRKSGRIKAAVVPVKLISTVLTITFGGSVGREGPAAQIGAGLMSGLSDLFQFDDHDRRKLVICGISAGFAAVFGTPIAGAIFGVEVLFVGSLMYDVLLPSFISGVIGFEVSKQLGFVYPYASQTVLPAFSGYFFLDIVLAGIFFGAVSWIFIEVVNKIERFLHGLPVHFLLKAVVIGTGIVILATVLTPVYLGLSPTFLAQSLNGESIPWYGFLAKMVFSGATLGAGGSGGLLTDVFVVGASAGNTFAHLLGLNAVTFAAIGFVAVLAGTSNTPIAASIMSVELFGPAIGSYAAICCVISFLITGHRSIYPSQIFAMTKSASIQIKKGEVRDVKTEVVPKDPRLAQWFFKIRTNAQSRMDRFWKNRKSWGER